MREMMRHMEPRLLVMLERSVIELNSTAELMKLFGWKDEPRLERPDMHEFESVTDVNERRVRDAEVLGAVMRNARPKVALEIGTSNGMATVQMAENAPEARIHTVNILPEEIAAGTGGELTTIAIERDKIGAAFRGRGLNIEQIYANTATWEPNIGTIDVAFIDGCHDTEFVFNDTRKVLAHARSGSFILWHDFNPSLRRTYPWIQSVCLGVEKLYWRGLISGNVFHVRDSWIGVYRVP
jgi:predicted O-methyltransferase YrrM